MTTSHLQPSNAAFFRGQRLVFTVGARALRDAYVFYFGASSDSSRCICVLEGQSVEVSRRFLAAHAGS